MASAKTRAPAPARKPAVSEKAIQAAVMTQGPTARKAVSPEARARMRERYWNNRDAILAERSRKYRAENAAKRIRPRGAALAWIKDHVEHAGDDCIIWPFCGKGPSRPQIRIGGKTRSACRVMCEFAHGPAPSDGFDAAHSCRSGSLGCINPRHLSWKTPTENAADMERDGTMCLGEKSSMARLTESAVKEMRELSAKGVGIPALAIRFGVTHGAVASVTSGGSWRHVPGPRRKTRASKRPHGEETIGDAVACVGQGMSLSKAAEKFDVCRKAVARAMRPPVIPEADIQSALLSHWESFGIPNTLVAAIPNQKAHGMPGLTPGIPDILVVGGNVRVGFIELKREGGRASVHQLRIIDIMHACGVPAVITFGRDEPIRVLERWGVVRRAAS